MTFLDFFSGVGGFTRGMELVGHKCIGHCEIDKFAEASYRSMHCITEEQREYLATLPLKDRQKEILKKEYLNGEWYADDVGAIEPGTIPTADCWCFGFPCQDISIAGLQRGFTGDRSSLFFRVMYLLGKLRERDRPKYLFIENVKNLISIHSGFDFARVLTSLDEGGYDAEWRIINSKDHDVPQNRERVFIIGRIRGRGLREVLPIGESNGETSLIQGHEDGFIANAICAGDRTANAVYPIDGEGGTESQRLSQGINAGLSEEVRPVKTDVASTLCARDYKGPSYRDARTVVAVYESETDREYNRKSVNKQSSKR